MDVVEVSSVVATILAELLGLSIGAATRWAGQPPLQSNTARHRRLVGGAAGTWERLGRIDVGNRGVTAWRSVRDVLDEARGTS